jgi:hypothetical protein
MGMVTAEEIEAQTAVEPESVQSSDVNHSKFKGAIKPEMEARIQTRPAKPSVVRKQNKTQHASRALRLGEALAEKGIDAESWLRANFNLTLDELAQIGDDDPVWNLIRDRFKLASTAE